MKQLKNAQLDEKKLNDIVKEEISNMKKNINTKTIDMIWILKVAIFKNVINE